MNRAYPSVPAPPYIHQATGLVFPRQLEHFQLAEVIDHEPTDPGLGVSIPYNAPTCKATLYLYTFGHDVPDGTGELVNAQFDTARKDVLTVQPYAVPAGRLALQGIFGEYSFPSLEARFLIPRTDDDPAVSTLTMFGLAGHYVKLRVTVRGDSTRFAGFRLSLTRGLKPTFAPAIQASTAAEPLTDALRQSAEEHPLDATYLQVGDLYDFVSGLEWATYRTRFDARLLREIPPYFVGAARDARAKELAAWADFIAERVTGREAVTTVIRLMADYYKDYGYHLPH